MLNQELIIELKDILKDDFGISLTIEETMQFASVFIKYFDLLAKKTHRRRYKYMAKARMLHKKISISLDVNKLPIEAQLLFTWLIAHADDDGRIKGEPEYIKATVIPMKNWSANKVNKYLELMKDNGLIYYWQEENMRLIEFPKWKDFQTIQNDRYKKSDLPSFLKFKTSSVDTSRIQPGYKVDTQSNISESNPTEVNKSEYKAEVADKNSSFKRVSDIQNPNALLDPNRYQPKNAEEAAAKEVWFLPPPG